jgi:hypothetical protein
MGVNNGGLNNNTRQPGLSMLIDYQQFERIAQQLQQSLSLIGVLNDDASAFKYSCADEVLLGKQYAGRGFAAIHLCFKNAGQAELFHEVFASYSLSYKFRGAVLCSLDLAIGVDHPLNNPVMLNQACQTLADRMGVSFLPPNVQAAPVASTNGQAPARPLADRQASSQVCSFM